MVVDDLFGVVHTAVTDFDGVAVVYFAQSTPKCVRVYIYIYNLDLYYVSFLRRILNEKVT